MGEKNEKITKLRNLISLNCEFCNDEVDLENEEIIYNKTSNKFSHKDCWIKNKLSIKRYKNKTYEDFINEANKKIEQSLNYIQRYLYIKNEKEKEKEEKAIKFNRKKLTNYLMEKYEITSFPKYFYIKLDNIYKGLNKNQSKPVLPEHLYDMWTRKQNYLDKIYIKNKNKGKLMDSYTRVNYDLAILLTKYDDYLKWLNKQKTFEEEKEILKENITSTEVTYRLQGQERKQANNDSNKNNDMADILDELI